MNFDELDIIVQHSVGSLQNLETALNVHGAYEAIRHKVISDAMDLLEVTVRAIDFGSQVEIRDEGFKLNPIPSHSNFIVRLRSWPANLSVRVSSDDPGAGDVFIGVHDQLSGIELREQLIERLFPGGKSFAEYGWQWWYYLEPPLRSWNNKTALLALRNPVAVSELAADLAALVKAMDELLLELQFR